jgi:hypothetical protein
MLIHAPDGGLEVDSVAMGEQVRDRHPAHFRATARGRFPTSAIGIITTAKL